MKYSPKIPTNDEEAYHYNRWWIDHVNRGDVIGGKSKAKTKGKQLTEAQKQSRKRFFITQAQQKKKAAEGNPKYGIPTASQHKRFFANHTGQKGGKAKAKTKHIDPNYQVPTNQDPDEGPAPKQAKPNPPVQRQDNWAISPSPPPSGTANSQPQTPQPERAPATSTSEPVEDQQTLERVMAEENDVPMEPDSSMFAGSGAGDGDIGGGGGGGVGNSTGSWNNETVWSGNTVITNASRHCVCLPRNGDLYKLINNIPNTGEINMAEKTTYLGFTTPWNYIDFNQYAIHFKPSDWQTLLNNFAGWRPRKVNVKIFNIQVIQKTETDGGNAQFNNDLTGTIQVFADQQNKYPKIMYPTQTTLMGCFPNMIYYTPQYGYLTALESANNPGNATQQINQYSQFFCLDENPSAMLRTGNTWSSSFTFGPDTPYCSNKSTTRYPGHRVNPLYDTWQVNPQNGDAKTGNFNTWRSPWLPGPYLDLNEAADNIQVTKDSHVSVGYNIIPLNPGPPVGYPANRAHSHAFWIPKSNQMNNGDLNDKYIDPSTANLLKMDNTRTYYINPSGTYRLRAASDVGGDNNGPTRVVHSQGLLPGMMWDNRAPTYWDCIWQEYPETDFKCFPYGRLGGIHVDAAPGHIFLKLTPKPTGEPNSVITQYATFTITVTIEWELKPYTYGQWNMRPAVGYTLQRAQEFDGMCDADGNYIVAPSDAAVENNYTGKVCLRTN